MNCGEFQEWLLEVDPPALAGALSDAVDRSVSPAAARLDASAPAPDHLRTCSSCRRAADRVLADQEHLAAGMASLAPVLPLEESTASAIRESARRENRLRRGSWMAVAAAVAGALALNAPDVWRNLGPETAEVALRSSGSQFMPEVEAMLDESVLVLETDNEDVVVFWFYQGRGE